MGKFNKNQIEMLIQNKTIVDEAPYSISENLVLSYYIEIAETYFPKIGEYRIYKDNYTSGFANFIIIQIIEEKFVEGSVTEKGPFVMLSMLGRYFCLGQGKTVKTKTSFLPIDCGYKIIKDFENIERSVVENKIIGVLNYLGFEYTKAVDYNKLVYAHVNTIINNASPSIEWDLLYNICG